mmetsp:Transcript_9201/g.8585  ORF Transcript_9201/g.8585 Transcript_9201/m.8585 type:complete len:589 (-) Transcript_9201:385-2151(-)
MKESPNDLSCFEWVSQMKFGLELESRRIDEIEVDKEKKKEPKDTLVDQYNKKIEEWDRSHDPGKSSLGDAVRKKIRQEVEEQAIKAEQEKVHVQRIRRLATLYQSVLEVEEGSKEDVYFEYSSDYKSLKKDKKDYNIYAYLLSFYQNYEFEFNPTEGQVLVNTPLTQRCMLNLFSAISLNLGGMINGNFGVGKTETIKSLARSLAKPFIVWSCRGGCSYSGLSRIFSGMVIGGWWLCLDEINQLEIQVMSTLIQQVLNIKNVVYQMKKTLEVNLAGGIREVPYNSGMAIFSTFTYNECLPTRRLHEKQKQSTLGSNFQNYPHILFENFRVIYMITPDTRIILTAKLLMLGFNNPLALASKIMAVLQMFTENLIPLHSKQADQHYESASTVKKLTLTLRSTEIIFQQIKYVMRTFRYSQEITEEYIIANALRGAYFYQLNLFEKELFEGIISNVFCTKFNDLLSYSIPQEDKLRKIIKEIIQKDRLSHSDQLVVKTTQLLDALGLNILFPEVRKQHLYNCAILVGRPMSGKSSLISVAAQAYSKISQYRKSIANLNRLRSSKKFNLHNIKVDSLSVEQLFGFVDDKNYW